MTSNPRSQPDTHFAIDMFPYKKTGLFQKSGFKSTPPKKTGNTPLSGTYYLFLTSKLPSQRFATCHSIVALLLSPGWLSHGAFLGFTTTSVALKQSNALHMPRAELDNYTFRINGLLMRFVISASNQYGS